MFDSEEIQNLFISHLLKDFPIAFAVILGRFAAVESSFLSLFRLLLRD